PSRTSICRDSFPKKTPKTRLRHHRHHHHHHHRHLLLRPPLCHLRNPKEIQRVRYTTTMLPRSIRMPAASLCSQKGDIGRIKKNLCRQWLSIVIRHRRRRRKKRRKSS